MEKDLLFADVILPIAVPNLYTYSIPDSLQKNIKAGQRVVVQFGKKKLYTALVRNVHNNKPQLYKAKQIESILDAEPIVNEKQFALWKWIADYYMCTLGEVMNAALPSGLKLSSETKLLLNPEAEIKGEELTDDEFLIYEALQTNEVLTLNEVEEIVQSKSALKIIKSLLDKNFIQIYEELRERFKPKIEEFVRLTEYASDENNLKKIFDELEKRAFKQLEVLMEFVHETQAPAPKGVERQIKKSELLKRTNASPATIESLITKNVFEVFKKETGRFAAQDASSVSKTLSHEQQSVLEKIKEEWKKKEVVLFHGVTSSGKTEIYVRLIEETLKQGKQVLYLLPEIALTTQVVSRIKKYFGDKLGVYHSKFNENERVEVWNHVLKSPSPAFPKGRSQDMQTPLLVGGREGLFQVILGARSSLFLPYSNLGLVIVDEEHDSSYKQFDPAPRYHARDSAILLASIHKAKVLLGSATPSLESYFNAQNDKYGFAELTTRFGGVQLPEILIADIQDDTKRKKMKSHFSPLLMENIELALKNKEQVILFQNRRGFAPYLECKTCGWTPICKNCDVSLVYHKSGTLLRCHYCGYTVPVPVSCYACGNTDLQMKSFGTEKIEEELQLFFPETKIARMDLDSTRSRFAHEHLINDFEERNIDILVGTQMVIKGLDFENVSTVGILNADQMMNFPDFRSHERSFQLMAQVAGRSGRNTKRGKVILQTYSPKHKIIQHVIENNFIAMYNEEMEHRRIFEYPPFHRLIELTVMDKDIHKVNAASEELGKKLKSAFGKRVLGPEFPLIPRIKNLYHKKIVIKIAREESANKAKEKIRSVITELQNYPPYKYLRVQADVDPV
ncbi:MAG: primosomal protein N' [Bacteroidetes bacterium]|nr:primosomal protein N' [Bacteroidota bacterium]